MTEEPHTPDHDDTAPTEPQPPKSDAPPPSEGVRRLTRSSSDKLIGGVSGGLGRYFGVDPILFRIAFVVLTFAGGVGVLAYIGLLAFVPADDDSRPFGERRDANMIGAVLLGVVVVIILGPPFFFVGPALIPIAMLIGIGVLLWRAAGGRPPSGDPGRLMARVVIALLIGIAAVGGFAGVFVLAALGGGTMLAVLAIVAGVALVVAGLSGGARWLIAPALVLVLPLAIVAAADIRVDGGVGERQYRPASVAELRPEYQLGMGELVVDMRDVDLPAGTTKIAPRARHRACRRARARGCVRVLRRADRRGPRAGASIAAATASTSTSTQAASPTGDQPRLRARRRHRHRRARGRARRRPAPVAPRRLVGRLAS